MRAIMNHALEGMNGMATDYGNISREEEEVMADEAADAAGEAQTGLDESERMLGLTDSLEDLAEIASGIEEATPVETQLLTVAGNMAVAGSDVPADEIVPAMEGFIGKRIACEGFREKASAIFRAIMAQVKKVWGYIEKFFYNIFGTIPRLKKDLKELRSRVDGVNGRKLEEKKITVSSGVKALSVDYSTPKNGADITKGLSTLLKEVGDVYGPYTDKMAKVGEVAADHMSDFDADKPAESVEKFLKAVTSAFGGLSVGSSAKAAAGRFPGFTVAQGDALPGNVSLFLKKIETSGARDHGSALLNQLEHVRHAGIELHATSDKDKSVPNDFQMDTMTSANMHTAIDDMEKILDKLEDFNRGKRTAEMKKTRTRLEAAGEKASKAAEKADKSSEASDRAVVAYYRGLVSYNQAYARWCQNPAVPLLNSSLATVRSSISVIAKSISAYK